MKSLNPLLRRSTVTLCGGLVLSLTFLAPVQGAPTSLEPWTTIGATGTPILGTYSYQDGVAFLSSASGILRYNVEAVSGLLDTAPGPSHIRMTARFRDPDAASRVRINLRRVRISDGFTANVAGVALDSDNYAPGGFLTRNTVCASTQLFDFVNYVYYVEVIMTRAPGAFSPAIGAIQIGWDNSPCLAPLP